MILRTSPNACLWVCICFFQLLDDTSLKNNWARRQEGASSDYLSTIARGLSLDHPCRFIGAFLIPGFYLTIKCPLIKMSLSLLSATIPTNPIPRAPIPTGTQSAQEISSISHSQWDLGVPFSVLASLLPSLYGSVDCNFIILYFTTNIHLVSMYHVLFLSPGYFTQGDVSQIIIT